MKLKNKIRSVLTTGAMLALLAPVMVSCSDEPDAQYFYTFEGEMMSDYLNNRPQFSEFAAIVKRARMNDGSGSLMDLLSSYGRYTCFVPTNEAVNEYLKKRGLSSVDELSVEDCDTIAKTHVVGNLYSTFDMVTDRLPNANLLGRFLATAQGVDENGKAVVFVEGTAHVYYNDTLANGAIVHQNDTVENGFMQPINQVLEKSNSYIVDLIRENETLGIFYSALYRTGVVEQMQKVVDADYKPSKDKYAYKSHTWSEVAWQPDTKEYGYTVFVEPDELLLRKFGEKGYTSEDNLLNLYHLAADIYKDVYPQDVDKDGWKFENLTDSINPLKRFVQYHVLDRKVAGTADLTPPVMQGTNEAFGINTKLQNPVDWYTTLLPHTMVKIEQLTMDKDEAGNDCRGADADKVGQRFVNRRYASPEYEFRGAYIDPTIETEHIHDAQNGHYFYVDDIVAFSHDVQYSVQNMRIRMDFSTIFPEVMSNSLRQEGNPFKDDSQTTPDESAKPTNGRNYYFPEGYLDGVKFDISNTHVVLRRPHTNFWSWQGDEWNLFGDYDLTFRIPPVPYSGEWQLRLGFCALDTRGVMQVYFDGKPQGIPLDMTRYLNSEMYLGSLFGSQEHEDLYTGAGLANKSNYYMKKTDEEKAAEQKVLRNLGAYRAGRATYHFQNTTNNPTKSYFTGNYRTYRRVLCQTRIDANSDHYIRFRVASDGKQGNNNEFMLDYFELVPRSVYGVEGTGAMEDDL